MAFQPSLHRPALAALVAAACCANAPVVAGGHGVPFKATVQTHEVLYPDPSICPNYPYLVGSTTGTGTASHLGAASLVASDCVTPGLDTFSFSDGKLTLTAANGDRLTAIYSGVLQPQANATAYSLYTISGSVTITGGTGRFVGASGSGYLSGTENLQTGQGQFEVTATLAY